MKHDPFLSPTATPDWAERLKAGKMPLREAALPTQTLRADRISRFFNQLAIPDIEGQPEVGDVFLTTYWVDAIGRALFGGDDIREAFVLTPKKQSKALPLDTEVATPAGFSTIRALQVGDEVLAPDGSPTRVLGKSEVFLGRTCYELEFSTGEVVTADAQHRWMTDAHKDRERARTKVAPSFKTTEQIAQSVVAYTHPEGKYLTRNHRVAVPEALSLPHAELPVDPYALGFWLGDGTSESEQLTVGSEDVEFVQEQLSIAGYDVTHALADPRSTAVRLSFGCGNLRATANGQFAPAPIGSLRGDLRAAGVLGNKHIPGCYLRASKAQRLALLQGLMDSDGHVNLGTSKTGGAVFAQSNRRLIDDVVELVATLGLKPTVKEYRSVLGGRDCGPTWRVLFAATQEHSVFRLPRKLNRMPVKAANWTRSAYRQIVAVREVPSQPTQCITVASPTEQFLIGRTMIPTGNTTSGALLYLAAFLANKVPNHSFTIIAPTVTIASFAFDTISAAIKADAELSAMTKIRSHIKEVEHLETQARISVKALSLQTLTGLRGSVFFDELHVAGAMRDGQKLRQQLRGALASNPNARALYITTQSDSEPAGIFKAMLSYARQVRDGQIIDPGFLPVLYEPWPGSDPWNDESIWGNLMPSYPHIAGAEFYRAAIAEANASGTTAVAEAKSQYFNIQIGISDLGEDWLVADSFDALKDPDITLDYLMETADRLAIGIDLGGEGDLSSLAVLAIKGSRWELWTRSWLTPEGQKRNVRNASRFQEYADAGDLVLAPPGRDVTDMVGICERVRETGKLTGVGVDPAGAADLADDLETAGFVMEEDLHGVGQSAFRLAPAVRTLGRKVERNQVLFAAQPIVGWALNNVVLRQKGNAPSIEKSYARDRIDPVAAILDAVTIEIHHREEPTDVLAMVG